MKDQKPKTKHKFQVFLPLILCIVTLLTGCVKYDIGINFAGLNQGEIVQKIQIGERLKNFSNETFDEWLKSIETRTRNLEGKVKKVSDQELIVTIPFHNGKELETKYNQFFNPVPSQKNQYVSNEKENLPELRSDFQLKQSNFLFLVRNHLIYDLDLRSLSLTSTSADGNIKIDPGSLLNLEFRLNTPKVARSLIKGENAINPQIQTDGKQLSWELQPGKLNHLEAVFWLPSPLGIGTFVIILLVLGGRFLKYQVLTNPQKSHSRQIPQS